MKSRCPNPAVLVRAIVVVIRRNCEARSLFSKHHKFVCQIFQDLQHNFSAMQDCERFQARLTRLPCELGSILSQHACQSSVFGLSTQYHQDVNMMVSGRWRSKSWDRLHYSGVSSYRSLPQQVIFSPLRKTCLHGSDVKVIGCDLSHMKSLPCNISSASDLVLNP